MWIVLQEVFCIHLMTYALLSVLYLRGNMKSAFWTLKATLLVEGGFFRAYFPIVPQALPEVDCCCLP